MLERLEASAWLGFDVPDVVRHELQFEEVLGVIDAVYEYTPAAFTNGATQNEAGQNVGSCKLLGWALLRGLSRRCCAPSASTTATSTPRGRRTRTSARGWSTASTRWCLRRRH